MNWISIGDDNFKIFELFRINNQVFNNLELKHMLYANAKYGGPIAITSHPDHILMSSDSNIVAIQNICIFKNNGILSQMIPKAEMGKIVGFDFTEDEQLFVLLQNGKYFLIDPCKGTKKEFDFGQKFANEPIAEAKVIDNSVIFYTLKKDLVGFYYIRNIHDPQINQYQHGELRAIPTYIIYFYPISAKTSLSEKLECLVTHPTAGVIRLVDNEPDCVFYNSNPNYIRNIESLAKLPEIRGVRLIAISPSVDIEKRLTAYFTEQNTIYIVSANFSSSFIYKCEVKIDQHEKQEHKKSFNLFWCCEDALLLIYGKTYQIITTQGVVLKKANTKGILGYQEIDGVKLVTNTKCEIFKKLPQYYLNVFQINSKAKGIDLYYASNEFENREASYQNSIIVDKKGLQEGVEDCLNSACFEINIEEQTKLLKAAHFGKTFLTSTNSKFDHDTFAYACKSLRVVNALRNESISRAITYEQFISLDPGRLIRILLRYQLYYLADEICKYLNFDSKFISNVYVSWACSKIESDLPEDFLAAVIYEKLNSCVNVSYTEIAKRARQLGKKKLATKLIEFEPLIKRKVPVLLWMLEFEEALKEAIRSRDPNLIYEVIFKMMKSAMDSKFVYNLIGKNTIAKPFMIYYLRNFDQDLLDDYFLYPTHSNEEKGLYFISKAYQTKDLNKRLNIIKDAAFKALCKERFYDDVTKEHIELLTKITTDTKAKVIEEKSIKQYIELYINLEDIDTAEKLKKTFKVTDKSYLISRIKILADKSRWKELESLIQEKNKRSAIVPYYAIVEILVDYNQLEFAEKYVVKMPDIEDQLMTLRMMGRFKTLAEVAFNNKKYKILEELDTYTNLDANVKTYVNDCLNKIGKRR